MTKTQAEFKKWQVKIIFNGETLLHFQGSKLPKKNPSGACSLKHYLYLTMIIQRAQNLVTVIQVKITEC